METQNTALTNIESLGEFGLIEHLTQHNTTKHITTLKSVGDDCAIIDHGNHVTAITTDMLVENVHFDLIYTPLRHLGYKAVTVNLSDVAAMNVTPTHITVSIALSSKYTLEAVEEIYAGIYLACEKYKIDLVGGDTTTSQLGLVISVTAWGDAPKEEIVYRNGASETDLLFVSGDLGAAYLGLQILEREKQVFLENKNIQPDLEGNDYILQRQLKPEPRTDVKELLRLLEIQPTSMIDVSDGISSELLHICRQSNVGCSIYEEKIPIDPTAINTARDFVLDPVTCALNGGEDYELLFSIKLSDYDKIKGNPNFTAIGHITNVSAGCNLVSNSGVVTPLIAQGWNALLKNEKVDVK
jgi:thiamine-monophosphate kinase